MTLIGYFNSIRELGGMRRVVDGSLRIRLQRMDERGLVKRFITTYGLEELTSRKGVTDIPRILDQLQTSFSRGYGSYHVALKKPIDIHDFPLPLFFL
jgi:repressor of nif and glnA expression